MCEWVRVGGETTGRVKLWDSTTCKEPDHLTTCTCVLGGSRKVRVGRVFKREKRTKKKKRRETRKEKIKIAATSTIYVCK